MSNPWKIHADRLVAWNREHLVVRDDAYGRYQPKEEQSPGKVAYTSKTALTDDLLKSHFAGEITLGLHTTDDRDRCLWGLVDRDNHDGQGDREAIHRVVVTWHERSLSLGIAAILEDSDGRGGHKLWLLFRERVEARVVRRLLGWVSKGWAALGLRDRPELFPKRDSLNANGLGVKRGPLSVLHCIDQRYGNRRCRIHPTSGSWQAIGDEAASLRAYPGRA